jgi:hypothetical protein
VYSLVYSLAYTPTLSLMCVDAGAGADVYAEAHAEAHAEVHAEVHAGAVAGDHVGAGAHAVLWNSPSVLRYTPSTNVNKFGHFHYCEPAELGGVIFLQAGHRPGRFRS